MPGPVQKTPGLTGLRQCFASGQQNDPASHVDLHGAPAATQIFVSGQQTGNAEPSHIVAFLAHDTLDGVKHCFASGQQYSEGLHFDAGGDGDGGTGGTGGSHGRRSPSIKPGASAWITSVVALYLINP